MADKFAVDQSLLNLESALHNLTPALKQQSLSLECDGNDKRLNPRFKEELYFHSPFTLNSKNTEYCHMLRVSQLSVEERKLDRVLEGPSLLQQEKSNGELVMKKSKKQIKNEKKKKSAGDKWFNLGEKQPMDDEAKMNVEFIQMRTLADPKLFMKQADKRPDHVEIGTMVSSAKDYYADKRSKGMLKDKNFADLLIENQKFKQFARRQRMENERVNSWKKHKRRKLEK